jgi:hypothetical protein
MTEDIIWESTLDSRYRVVVIRTGHYQGEWSLHDGEQLLDRQNVGLSYGALFGSAVDDVADWQQRAIRFIDGLNASSS